RQHRAHRSDPAPVPGDGAVRHVRRRLCGLPQPPRRGAAPVAVHDRADGPLRPLLARVVHLPAGLSHHSRPPSRVGIASPRMNRIDHAVIGGLVLLIGVIAVVIGAPALMPAAAAPTPAPTAPTAVVVPYREGVLGRAVSVNPLGARTQADRDLVALVFEGLVARGPDGTLVPGLASRWTEDPAGKSWTFTLRPDAKWQDGEPVTAD